MNIVCWHWLLRLHFYLFFLLKKQTRFTQENYYHDWTLYLFAGQASSLDFLWFVPKLLISAPITARLTNWKFNLNSVYIYI
jgi:hypothetical protein